MTKHATLNASLREETGKGPARRLRAEGMVPAVVYGKEMDTISLKLNAMEAEHLFRAISVDNTIVELSVEGTDEPLQTLVREIQTHPFKTDLIHIDFLRIQEGVAVEVDVPIHLNGVPQGVKASGGVLEQIVHDLPVKCVPDRIPESVEVDVAELEIGDAVHVSDLEVGEGVEILMDPEQTVCTVVVPKVIEVEVEEEEGAEVLLVGEEEEPGEAEEEMEPEEEAAERGEAAREEE